jgi:hypothetical protein
MGVAAGPSGAVAGATTVGAHSGAEGAGIYSTAIGAGVIINGVNNTAAHAQGSYSVAVGGGDGARMVKKMERPEEPIFHRH